MSAAKVLCRICEKAEKKVEFEDVFDSRFTPERATEEVFLYEAMQQLTGVEVCLR